MINIKIGSVTTVKEMQQLEGLNVSFGELDFVKGDAPAAGSMPAPEDLAGLDLDMRTVGVFSNADYEEINAVAEKYGLDIIQLDGDEDPDLCADLSDDYEVIKTFRVGLNTGSIDKKIKDFDDVCDYYLFDSVTADKKFDWQKLAESKIEKPFFIGGSIGPADAALLKKFRHPDFYGVSLANLFLKDSGGIDMALLLKFVRDMK